MADTKESSLKVVDVHIDDLVLNKHNINEMSETTLQRLVEEIRDVGFLDPINVVPTQDGKYIILGGEHRYKAAKIAGMTYVPAVVHTDEKWSDQDLFGLVAFRLNVLRGSQNPEKFMKDYERLSQKFGTEKLQDIFAVTDKSLWRKLTKSVKKDLKGLGHDVESQIEKAEENAGGSFEKFAKSVQRIMKNHAEMISHGCVIFMNGKSESIAINANDNVFEAIKTIAKFAADQSKNVNEYIEPVLIKTLSEMTKCDTTPKI
jgi:ParB/RepB/Spo0J family partition protein